MTSPHMGLLLGARTVLSAPASPHEIEILNQTILAVSVLSIVGAAWIILSFCSFKEVRSFRHQLILGLAISDLFMAVNFLSSSALNLAGYNIGDASHQPFCSFNGFMTQFFVVQTDYWVLMIAICTFLILANHKHLSTWIQEHRILLWCLPWGLSLLWAALGVGLDGYSNIGAWCWFGSDTTRLLVNFVPRWLIIILILGLYARLYRLLISRAHEQFISFSDEASPYGLETPNPASEIRSVPSTQRIGQPSASMNVSTKDDPIVVDTFADDNNLSGRTHVRGPSPVIKKVARQMMMYPAVYALIWVIPTTIRIYQSITKTSAPFGIATLDKACIVIQGFADAIIYGVNESSLIVWRNKFRKAPPMAPAPAPVALQVNIETEIRLERVEGKGAGSENDSIRFLRVK